MEQLYLSKSYNNNLPYVYQAEYLSLAWGYIRKGFFIDPEGIKYKYSNPNNWNDCIIGSSIDGSCSKSYNEIEAVIRPEDLYANMSNSRKRNVLFKFTRTPLVLSQTILDDLLKSEVVNYGQMMWDAGLISHSLFIYDEQNKLYRRILLSCDLDFKVVNQSQYAYQIVRSLGSVYGYH
jgi:hypothetical protein